MSYDGASGQESRARELVWLSFFRDGASIPSFVRRVLLAGETSLAVASAPLKRKKFDVREASSAMEAFRAAKTLRPDLVILDSAFDDMTGENLVADLRGHEATRDIAIVMVASPGRKTVADDGGKLGADLFLLPDALRLIIEKTPARRDRPRKRRILAVEDDESFRETLQFAFPSKDVDLLFAQKAKDGYLTARKERPDVILLDLGLPGTPGQTALALLKQDAMTTGIPVIVMTAFPDEGGVIKHYVTQAGAADILYKHKPLAATDLQEAVGRAVKLAQASTREADVVLERGRLRVSMKSQRLWADERPVKIGPQCLQVLRVLIARDKPILTEELLAEAWERGQNVDTVHKTIQRIRALVGREEVIVSTADGFYLQG